ncbi:nitrogen permease regulator 2 [Nadsonia fulvescens var. elongata DSM 6958]|uniref:Nitrogen permease regulator 2 n=1 Tax=Nadsonia fulvescens var. elongata DSM 6958 TaxID=857566 RepID=A0A1E3PMH6_9ASCO|nr:nitrogen permease regulator 2 [Nadsonia fulvescens var. elongata DSM 6958]
MTDFNGFATIEAIFYSSFHITEGSKVVHQVPSGSIVPEEGNLAALSHQLFDFNVIKNYIIPKPALCDRLVTLRVGNYRLIGHPVAVRGTKYARNFFTFNFVFVFASEADSFPFEPVARRMSKMFEVLEEQSQFLSNKATEDSVGNIIEQLYQDINNYSECFIPIEDGNNVDIKLFPMFPPPPDIKSFHVPLCTVRLELLIDVNWDPTMERILPFIDGINSVRQIAELAEANYSLTKRCIQHLMYYQCIIIGDIFQFDNIYAPTSDIGLFVQDSEMSRECQLYVYVPPQPTASRNKMSSASVATGGFNSGVFDEGDGSTPESILSTSSSSPSSMTLKRSSLNNQHNHWYHYQQQHLLPAVVDLFALYRSLHQGQTVRDWYIEHKEQLKNIDIRRFLSFGVINNLIYRIYSYPVLEAILPLKRTEKASTLAPAPRGGRSSTKIRPDTSPDPNATDLLEERVDNAITELAIKPRHLDAICTYLQASKEDVKGVLRQQGEWTIINR